MPEYPIRYRLADHTPVISVTQVLSLAGRIDSTWFTPESASRGEFVHRWTEAFDRGDSLQPLSVELMGYLEAYAAFKAVVKPEYCGSEVVVTSACHRVGGRVDRLCADLLGEPAIMDIKTGPKYPWHASQLAAYNTIHPTGATYGLYLQPNGRYTLKRYSDPLAYRQFFEDLARAHRQVSPSTDRWLMAPRGQR